MVVLLDSFLLTLIPIPDQQWDASRVLATVSLHSTNSIPITNTYDDEMKVEREFVELRGRLSRWTDAAVRKHGFHDVNGANIKSLGMDTVKELLSAEATNGGLPFLFTDVHDDHVQYYFSPHT